MITSKSTASVSKAQLKLMGIAPEKSVFFDIETTGLRASSSHLYLIGAAFSDRTGERWTLLQWMSEQVTEEAALLRTFAQFLRPYDTLIHFNGDRFDLPYLSEKYEQYGLENPFAAMASVDIYKENRALKQFFDLKHMNQRSLERFLGLHREDPYDGGQLIEVFHSYCLTGDSGLGELLLRHNREDLSGMLFLTGLYTYRALLAGSPAALCPDTLSAGYRTGQFFLRLALPFAFPVPLRRSYPDFTLELEKKTAAITAPVFEGELLYFFENYKDYYYLPMEDTAIHKSVALFMDRQYRERATAKNCYTRKRGVYLPQPSMMFTPVFRKSSEDKQLWFAAPAANADGQIEDRDFSIRYLKLLLRGISPFKMGL